MKIPRKAPIIAIIGVVAFLLALGVTAAFAGGEEASQFGRAIAAQDKHTNALLAREGVVGTAVGLNPAGRHVVQVFTVK